MTCYRVEKYGRASATHPWLDEGPVAGPYGDLESAEHAEATWTDVLDPEDLGYVRYEVEEC